MLVSEQNANLLEPIIRKVLDDGLRLIPSMLPNIFNMQSSSKAIETNLGYGGTPDWEDFNGKVQYVDAKEQFPITYTHVEKTSGLQIERKLIDDDQLGVIKKKGRGLGTAATRTREKSGASMFNNGFTDTSLGGDSLALLSTAHTSKTPGVNTQSNRGTSALSATAVEATRILMRDFRNWEGEKVSISPDLLLVPVNLEQTAWEIIASKGKVETANNNANFHFGKYKLAVWDFLTDSNNWFMLDSILRDEMVNWYDRVTTEINRDTDLDTLIARFVGYMRYSFGFDDWRWVFGSLVS